MSSLFPNLNLDLTKNGQAFRPINAMAAGSIQHFTSFEFKTKKNQSENSRYSNRDGRL
jgi:hypothetical protein